MPPRTSVRPSAGRTRGPGRSSLPDPLNVLHGVGFDFWRCPASVGGKISQRPHWPAPSADVEATLLDDLFFETLDKRDHVALFGLGHLELREGRGGMTEEHVPIALADAHA